MHTSKVNKFGHQLSSFITTLWAGANCKFMQLVNLTFTSECTTPQAMKQEMVYTQRQLRLTHKNFAILNSHITVIYLRFKKHLLSKTFIFMWQNRKIKNSCIEFFETRNLLYTIKWHVRKSYISKSLKK